MVELESVMPQTGRSGFMAQSAQVGWVFIWVCQKPMFFPLILKLFQAKIYNHHDK